MNNDHIYNACIASNGKTIRGKVNSCPKTVTIPTSLAKRYQYKGTDHLHAVYKIIEAEDIIFDCRLELIVNTFCRAAIRRGSLNDSIDSFDRDSTSHKNRIRIQRAKISWYIKAIEAYPDRELYTEYLNIGRNFR